MIRPADLKAALAHPAGASSDFDLNPGGGSVAPTKQAGVLVGFCDTPSGVQVLLTKRSAALRAHPGQISFPGGRRDDADQDIQHTALREAAEETGLPPGHVTVLGQMPPHSTVTAFEVTPVIGWITQPWDIQANAGEVDEVFFVPASHVLNPENYSVQGRYWRGGLRKYYTVPYGPYYIWGATARILYSLAQRMA